jgi:outer membrane protein TolC
LNAGLKHFDNRKVLRATAGIVLAFGATGTVRAQVSLGTMIELAQRNSTSVRLAAADLSKAQAQYVQSRDVYVPNLVFGSSIGPPSIGFPAGQPSVANASMQSLFFSFPQRQYINAARTGIDAATLALKDAREQVALDAATEYVELDTVDRELAASREQASASDRLLQIESERTEAGVDPLSELLQARLTAAQLNLKLMHLQSRAASLISQLSALTGLPVTAIAPDHASIPTIPEIKVTAVVNAGLEAAQKQARSKQYQAAGDEIATKIRPLIAFGAQYNRDATSLNNYNLYYGHTDANGRVQKFKADNFSAGFSIQIPIFDLSHKAKSRESAADALRATIESEQAQKQADVQVATLTASLRELDAFAEVASLKQQIANEQLKTVQTELQSGNGAGLEPGAPAQLSPKVEQQARIDERQKFVESLDAGFDLQKARLGLIRALGHIDDWLQELTPAAVTNETVLKQ